MINKDRLIETILNDLCLDERISDGTFDITNNDHMDIMREYLVNKGIGEQEALEFSNRVVEAGKYPERQAYNKNGILVTFPTPQHKQNAIRRGTHFEKDPTKGRPNIFNIDPETGKPKRGPGRPPKDDKEKDKGEFTPPSQGGGQSIEPDSSVGGGVPRSDSTTSSSPSPEDTETTTTIPTQDTDIETPQDEKPPDEMPPKPAKEKWQDKEAIDQMMNNKNVALGDPLSEDTKYDSEEDTKNHINRVKELMSEMSQKLIQRSNLHDKSKLEEPEKSSYDKLTPKLKEMTYGSDEYKESLKELGPALKHHYENNSHHPEHYEEGISGMSLLDLMEMICDWKASGERHSDGNIEKSIEINKNRFNIQDQLNRILENTAREMGWYSSKEN